jgi:hypothetical protein
MLSYIMYACQFSGAGSLKRFTTDRLRNTIHAAVSVRFQWGVFWVTVRAFRPTARRMALLR